MAAIADILVVTRRPDRFAALHRCLADSGFRVRTADALSGGADAVEDVAVLDIAALQGTAADRDPTVPLVLFADTVDGNAVAMAQTWGAAELIGDADINPFLALRLAPLCRLATMGRELVRRQGLADAFGMPVPPPASADDGPCRILVLGTDGDAQAVMESLPDTSKVAATAETSAVQDILEDDQFDACVLNMAVGREAVLGLCASLRTNPRLFNLPITVVGTSADDAEAAYGEGASRVLLPTDPSALLRFVLASQVAGQRRRRAVRDAIDDLRRPPIADAVTGIFNAEFLESHLNAAVADANHADRALTVVFLSVPELASVAAEFGDAAAGHLGAQIGTWVDTLVRVEDLTAGYGPHEFCVVLPDTPLPQAELVMRRTAGIVSHTDFALTGVFQPVSVAVEVAMADRQANDTAEDLLTRAHQALD